jgi:hypothetical protein
VSPGLLERIDAILAATGEADDALRETVGALAAEPEVDWAGIAFLEAGELVLGPSAGVPDEERRIRVPVAYQGDPVGELWVDGEADRVVVDRVAAAISGHVLIGWDTGGDAWEP